MVQPRSTGLDLYLQGALDSPFASFECLGWKRKDHLLMRVPYCYPNEEQLPTDHVLCVGLYFAILSIEELDMRDAMPLVAKGRAKLGNKRDSLPMRTREEKVLIAELWK